jgi:hypothetical protein
VIADMTAISYVDIHSPSSPDEPPRPINPQHQHRLSESLTDVPVTLHCSPTTDIVIGLSIGFLY